MPVLLAEMVPLTTSTTAAAILFKPILKSSFSCTPKLKPSKPILFLQFPASKSVFFGGFGCKRAVSKTMTELVKTSASRGSNGEESTGLFQQEAVVNGSNEFVGEGLEATLNRLSKWLVAGLFGAVILWRHDAEALWAAMGSVINVMLSIALKQILNQERPFSTSRSDPGMPSSHAQSIFYTVIYAILSIMEWLGLSEFTLILSAIALSFGSYFSWLRVSQRLHTITQVVVGAAVGSIFSILWYWSWNAIVLKAFISSLLVRIIVVLGAAAFCLGFLLHVIRHWLSDE